MTDDKDKQLNLSLDEIIEDYTKEGDKQEQLEKSILPQRARRNILGREFYPNLDAFVEELFSPRLDVMTAEHPVFSLNVRRSKCGGYEEREYQHNNSFLKITSPVGIANIVDKTIIIVAISHIIQQMNDGVEPCKTVLIRPYSLLRMTNREPTGKNYASLRDSLRRLHETTIHTNIPSGKRRIYKAFHLIDGWEVHEGTGDDGEDLGKTTGSLKITLSDWLFGAVVSRDVIKLPRVYFRVKSPLIRRLYEIALKHTGSRDMWSIRLSLLYNKSGYAAPKKDFKTQLKRIIKDNTLPDFCMTLAHTVRGEDLVIFTRDVSEPVD